MAPKITFLPIICIFVIAEAQCVPASALKNRQKKYVEPYAENGVKFFGGNTCISSSV
jgi:hypothetical protein